MSAPNLAPRSIRRPLPVSRLNARAAIVAVGWVFAALWPFAAFALLAFVVSDPLVTPMRLLLLSIAIAAGSAVTAFIDGWMLSNKTWWTAAQL